VAAFVPLLTDWKTESVELRAVFPAGRAAKAAARAFVKPLAGWLDAVLTKYSQNRRKRGHGVKGK